MLSNILNTLKKVKISLSLRVTLVHSHPWKLRTVLSNLSRLTPKIIPPENGGGRGVQFFCLGIWYTFPLRNLICPLLVVCFSYGPATGCLIFCILYSNFSKQRVQRCLNMCHKSGWLNIILTSVLLMYELWNVFFWNWQTSPSGYHTLIHGKLYGTPCIWHLCFVKIVMKLKHASFLCSPLDFHLILDMKFFMFVILSHF